MQKLEHHFISPFGTRREWNGDDLKPVWGPAVQWRGNGGSFFRELLAANGTAMTLARECHISNESQRKNRELTKKGLSDNLSPIIRQIV